MDVFHDEESNEFRIEHEGEAVGELGYSRDNGELVIEHTRVSDKQRGRGLGRKLVDAAVAFARENGERVRPVCSYARALFDKNTSYEDVRA